MTAMKRQKYRKGKQTKRKYLQTLCDLKVERKNVRKLQRCCRGAKAKSLKNKRWNLQNDLKTKEIMQRNLTEFEMRYLKRLCYECGKLNNEH